LETVKTWPEPGYLFHPLGVSANDGSILKSPTSSEQPEVELHSLPLAADARYNALLRPVRVWGTDHASTISLRIVDPADRRHNVLRRQTRGTNQQPRGANTVT
jgi:hypothetical protein